MKHLLNFELLVLLIGEDPTTGHIQDVGRVYDKVLDISGRRHLNLNASVEDIGCGVDLKCQIVLNRNYLRIKSIDVPNADVLWTPIGHPFDDFVLIVVNPTYVCVQHFQSLVSVQFAGAGLRVLLEEVQNLSEK
jgi:hypothetical protein